MLDYPVKLIADDNGTVLVSFPDFPEAHTFGDDVADALEHAKDALATVIEVYIKDRRAIPVASHNGKYHVQAPALLVAKARLSEMMRELSINKSELARRMHVHLPQVDRLLDVHHGSTIDQLESAFSAMGKRMTVSIVDAVRPQRAARKRPRPVMPGAVLSQMRKRKPSLKAVRHR